MADVHPLRRWREAHTITRIALAEKLGVTEMTVMRWEKREAEPQKRLWPKIEKRTGISRAEFLGFVSEVA